MKSKLVLFIIFVQLVAIGFVATGIFEKNRGHLSATFIVEISGDQLNFPDDRLKHFYEFKPNVAFYYEPDWLGRRVTYAMNSDGFNERFEYAVPKPEKTFRIVSLGDSHTFGKFVDTEENYSEVLEDLLNAQLRCESIEKFEVINFAIPGYDLEYSVERFRRRGQKYEPDLILWKIDSTDFEEIKEFHPNESELSAEERNAYQEAVIRSINDYHQKSIVFFLMPEPFELKKEHRAIIERFVQTRRETYFHDGIPNIKAVDGYYLPHDAHPNMKGHAMIASDIFTYLTEHSLVPCKS